MRLRRPRLCLLLLTLLAFVRPVAAGFNVNSPADVTKLRAELITDPRGYGYNHGFSNGQDQATADRLTVVRDGTNPPTTPTAAGGAAGGKIAINRPDVDPGEILGAIDVRDFAAAPVGVSGTALSTAWFESVTRFPRIPLANPDGSKSLFRKNIDRLVNDTQGSQTRLDTLAVRNGSRLEELFGAGSTIQAGEIGAAR